MTDQTPEAVSRTLSAAPVAETAGCEWPISYAGCSTDDAYDNLTDEEVAQVEQMAVEFLVSWTDGRYGICPVTVRPCGPTCAPNRGAFTGYATPATRRLPWITYRCATCGLHCSCSGGSRALALPGYPQVVTDVWIDGNSLPVTAYRLDGSTLWRTDGDVWPATNDLSLPTNLPGTWAVDYQRGLPVPLGGQIAAGVLAQQLARALCGKSCDLPARVQTITRQGVSMALIDSFDDIDKGRTGIWLIDSWLASVNRPDSSAHVTSVDRRTRA